VDIASLTCITCGRWDTGTHATNVKWCDLGDGCGAGDSETRSNELELHAVCRRRPAGGMFPEACSQRHDKTALHGVCQQHLGGPMSASSSAASSPAGGRGGPMSPSAASCSPPEGPAPPPPRRCESCCRSAAACTSSSRAACFSWSPGCGHYVQCKRCEPPCATPNDTAPWRCEMSEQPAHAVGAFLLSCFPMSRGNARAAPKAIGNCERKPSSATSSSRPTSSTTAGASSSESDAAGLANAGLRTMLAMCV